MFFFHFTCLRIANFRQWLNYHSLKFILVLVVGHALRWTNNYVCKQAFVPWAPSLKIPSIVFLR